MRALTGSDLDVAPLLGAVRRAGGVGQGHRGAGAQEQDQRGGRPRGRHCLCLSSSSTGCSALLLSSRC